MPEPRKLDLPEHDRQIVERILKARVPDRPVYAFGSRTTGRAGRRSDLDLAVDGTQELPTGIRVDLKEDFTESDLPIFVDVVDLNTVSQEFRKRIEPDFIPLVSEGKDEMRGSLHSALRAPVEMTASGEGASDSEKSTTASEEVELEDEEGTPFDKLREECG